jgi:hypothetical protein
LSPNIALRTILIGSGVSADPDQDLGIEVEVRSMLNITATLARPCGKCSKIVHQ